MSDLFPTQMTLGLREVDIKRRRWRDAKSGEERAQILKGRPIPVVRWRANRHYLIDRHHLTRALLDEGVTTLTVEIIDDLRTLDVDEFWDRLQKRGWMHPYDDVGDEHEYTAIPLSVRDLIDDPFRSLAGAVRRAGSYAKNIVPFSEFRWANFFRRRIERAFIESDFDEAVRVASVLADSAEAAALPGWLGRGVHGPA
ncbi:MAG TPA: ParB-like protein [Methylomirabilota bacterium]|nr:ParB-like protein [Methylomirabilota bacterium]